MKYQASITGALAALALMMAPGFTAQAANIDTSPDVSVGTPATASDIEALDTEVEDDVVEVEVADAEDIDTADVGDVETPDIEVAEVETPELGE